MHRLLATLTLGSLTILASCGGPPNGSFEECVEDIGYVDCKDLFDEMDANSDGIIQQYECEIFSGRYAELLEEAADLPCDEFP